MTTQRPFSPSRVRRAVMAPSSPGEAPAATGTVRIPPLRARISAIQAMVFSSPSFIRITPSAPGNSRRRMRSPSAMPCPRVRIRSVSEVTMGSQSVASTARRDTSPGFMSVSFAAVGKRRASMPAVPESAIRRRISARLSSCQSAAAPTPSAGVKRLSFSTTMQMRSPSAEGRRSMVFTVPEQAQWITSAPWASFCPARTGSPGATRGSVPPGSGYTRSPAGSITPCT